MKHVDLFSGIGGFAYAVDQVWENAEHIFCDNDKFCRQVLKKHWPNSKIYGDIKEIKTITDTDFARQQGTDLLQQRRFSDRRSDKIYLLTGGFPCQPFSQAGRRKGTEDDRWLWPEMLRVIKITQPQWIIAENVRGIITISNGLVLEQVCVDLERENYEVQPFIIPAVAVNAPHRRDRVWIVANRTRAGEDNRSSKNETTNGLSKTTSQNTINERSRGRVESGRQILECQSPEIKNERPDWSRNWLEVATRFCGMDDGLPAELDGFKLTKAGHRVQRLKALGNAIVPQVAVEIMKAIKLWTEK